MILYGRIQGVLEGDYRHIVLLITFLVGSLKGVLWMVFDGLAVGKFGSITLLLFFVFLLLDSSS